VDYALRAGLYTILNIHHEGEGGWFQTHIGTSVDANVDTKLKNYWTQIANKFKDYNERLMFAGANEPGSDVGDQGMTQQHVNTLMQYYQTFIDAVRATGSNNETRTLIIQGPNTNIDNSVSFATTNIFPKDKVEGRLMFEVHYYDPYQYTLMPSEQTWGDKQVVPQYYYGDYQKASEPTRNAGYNAWGGSVDQELAGIDHPMKQFAKMKTNFIDKGYPVIIGEFGANVRSPNLSGEDLNLSKQGRVQWHKDVVTAAKQYGLTPILWDMGNESNTKYDNMAYIRRQSAPVGKVLEVDVINAMRDAYGLGQYVNTGVTHVEDFITGATTAIRAQANVTVQLTRDGNMLRSDKPIRLFDMNGNLVRAVNTNGKAELSLNGLGQGMYIAKSAGKSLRVNVK
jgi:aryl-phospho-beta-D-glucosidase BglC (GH1 family)